MKGTIGLFLLSIALLLVAGAVFGGMVITTFGTVVFVLCTVGGLVFLK